MEDEGIAFEIGTLGLLIILLIANRPQLRENFLGARWGQGREQRPLRKLGPRREANLLHCHLVAHLTVGGGQRILQMLAHIELISN